MVMPHRRLFILTITLVLFLSAVAQSRFRVMTWNAENLFDTIDNPVCNDDEFLPLGARQWDSRRYWSKLGKMARVIAMVGGETPADLVALCEVEGDSVLHDLTQRTYLRQLGYACVAAHGDDVRGINVALLYQPFRFKPLSHREIKVPLAADERATRNVLLVSGLLQDGDTLDVFVCHLPSKRGGAKLTEKRRVKAAGTVRRVVDSLLVVRRNPRLLLMGDFNEEGEGRLFSRTLQAFSDGKKNGRGGLHLLTAGELNTFAEEGTPCVKGTYFFRGKWQCIDHVIVSTALMDTAASFHLVPDGCRIVAHPMLLEWNKARTQKIPKRTYQGPVYRGGMSDHLPLVADFVLKRKP